MSDAHPLQYSIDEVAWRKENTAAPTEAHPIEGCELSAAAQECWINSELHGFHEPSLDGHVSTHAERLMLIVSECSEALEELRKPEYDATAFGAELADIVIRTFDLAVSADIDIGQAIQDKHAKNIKRPFRHGGKRL